MNRSLRCHATSPGNFMRGCQAQRQPLLSALPVPVLHQCQHALTRRSCNVTITCSLAINMRTHGLKAGGELGLTSDDGLGSSVLKAVSSGMAARNQSSRTLRTFCMSCASWPPGHPLKPGSDLATAAWMVLVLVGR